MDYNITQEVMQDTLKLDEVVEFAENPEPRCPCVLLLDTSGSMQGIPIDALNQGLQIFKEELIKNSLAARRVEVAIVTFDSQVNVIQDFVTADQFNPPILTAQGLTTMGSGIHKALDMIQDRKAQYRANGVAYYRPWVFMITDGEPQGEFEDVIDQATRRVQADEASKRVAFFTVGVENANMNRLGQIAVRSPLRLTGLNFIEMFVWLSASMSAVSHSKVDEQVALPPIGWGSV
ncbi:VWA domain-containing protein [Scytonema sp. NUACC26]